MTAFDNNAKGLIRGLMYPTIFEQNPVDAVEHVLDVVVRRRAMDASPEQYAAAVDAALQSDESLAPLLPQPHSDATIRAFLVALRPHLPPSPPDTVSHRGEE